MSGKEITRQMNTMAARLEVSGLRKSTVVYRETITPRAISP